MRSYAYCRVSSGRQMESALSIRDQINQVIRYADYRELDLGPPTRPTIGDGNTVDSRERIVIEGVSAYAVPFRDRPGGQWLLKHIEPGSVIIVTHIDRVFRDVMDALSTAKAIKEAGAALHVCGLGLDLSTPIGEMALTVMAMVAQWESRMRSERQKARFRAAWATNPARTLKCRTHVNGPGGPLFGFRFDGELRRKECHLEPDDSHRWFMDLVYEMWATGWATIKIWMWLFKHRILRPDGARWEINSVREAIAVEHGLRKVEQEWIDEGVEFTYSDVAIEWLSRHAAAGLRRQQLSDFNGSTKSNPPIPRQVPLTQEPPVERPGPGRRGTRV